MAKKKKYYAVKKGRQAGIFETWEECRRLVQGYAGAVYKSFESRQQAEAYLQGNPAGGAAQKLQQLGAEKRLVAFVDGSFDKKLGRYSFGCVFLLPDGTVIKECGSGNDPASLALRNVTGEMLGAMFAVQWARENGFLAVNICYDYAGIEQWATHGWQAKNELTQKYAGFMDKNGQLIAITFTKIAAHTGNQYNEEADKLAKKALVMADGIPKVRKMDSYG